VDDGALLVAMLHFTQLRVGFVFSHLPIEANFFACVSVQRDADRVKKHLFKEMTSLCNG
jgi:hypothetical protein